MNTAVSGNLPFRSTHNEKTTSQLIFPMELKTFIKCQAITSFKFLIFFKPTPSRGKIKAHRQSWQWFRRCGDIKNGITIPTFRPENAKISAILLPLLRNIKRNELVNMECKHVWCRQVCSWCRAAINNGVLAASRWFQPAFGKIQRMKIVCRWKQSPTVSNIQNVSNFVQLSLITASIIILIYSIQQSKHCHYRTILRGRLFANYFVYVRYIVHNKQDVKFVILSYFKIPNNVKTNVGFIVLVC